MISPKQTDSDQKATGEAFYKPLRDIKHLLLRPFATYMLESYLVIPRNQQVPTTQFCEIKGYQFLASE